MKPKPRGINLHKLEVQAFLNGATQLRLPIKPQPPDAKSGQWGWIASSTDKKEVDTFRFSWIDDIGSTFTKRGRESYVAYKPPVHPGQIWFGREPFGYGYKSGLCVFASCESEASYVCFKDGSQKFRTGNYFPWGLEHEPRNWPTGFKWRQSSQMPQWASRIVRKCASVRVERLQDSDKFSQPGLFTDQWNQIHGPESWQQNPWLWVIESEVVQ